jgi:hypothetical protein
MLRSPDFHELFQPLLYGVPHMVVYEMMLHITFGAAIWRGFRRRET